MKVQAYTHEDLFALGVAIVRSVTGVEYPFTERTFHRALVQVMALFGANANVESLRLIKGGSLEGLRGQLLDRRVLENNTLRLPAQAARIAGRFKRSGAIGTAIPIPPMTVALRPATATQSEIAFRSEAAAVIPSADTESNLVFLTCTETGSKGNNIPSGGQLSLRNPITGVAYFEATTDAGGGYTREDDPPLRTRARAARRGHGECTWAGIESLLTNVELSSGQKVTSARLFEAFDEPSPLFTGLVYAIIDDGSGDSTLIGAIDSTTYGYGGGNWWQFDATSYHIYIRVPDYPFDPWDDGINAQLERYNGAAWIPQTEGVDYWVNSDTGMIALASPILVTNNERIRCQFNFYTGLVKEAARWVNGVYKSEAIKGWRPIGYPIRIRPPSSVVKPSVSGTLVFKEGWDSNFGRAVAIANTASYMNGLAIGDPARYDVIGGIVHKTPGLDYVSDLLLDGGQDDVPPSNKFGVVRADVSTIAL